MTDYTLYYWPLPFRGAFIRSLLALAGASWDEKTPDDVAALMQQDPGAQPVPLMAPPVLTFHADGLSISQMPAILGHIGRKHGLLPTDPWRLALTEKLIADANDVLYEITLHNGARMWTQEMWDDYLPRLARWMAIFEETGHRQGLSLAEGYLLGTGNPGVADVVVLNLWGMMVRKLPELRPALEHNAPQIAALADRMASRPEQAALLETDEANHGDAWCGGQIEQSLRRVLRSA